MIITKYNAVCNLGENIDEIFLQAMEGNAKCFDMYNSERVGVVKSNLPMIENSIYNTRTNQLILKALETLNIEELDKHKTAIVVATTNSGVEEYEKSKTPKHFEIGNPAEFIHSYFGFKNFFTSVSTACSSGVKAFSIARDLLEANIAGNVIVVGVDSITKLPMYGFKSLEILSNTASVPFSKNRCGINIGEGAGAFVLQQSGSGIKVLGIGETTDYFHSTTPEPEGKEAENAIRLALGDINPDEIDYINLHGTGTYANDLMESNAIYNVFGGEIFASSTKPLTGHCLGAAACIEAALCCKLLQEQCENVFPHIYDGEYDSSLPKIRLSDKNTKIDKIKKCISTSFGFGGTNCAMVLGVD